MTNAEALARADRHCDLEGLPPASREARKLDTELHANRTSTEEAIQALATFYRCASDSSD